VGIFNRGRRIVMTTNQKLIPVVFLFLVGLTMAQAYWIAVADFDAYQAGWAVSELKEVGWTFQDGAYADYSQCTDGTWDCDAVRVITSSPFNPTFGSDKSLMLRGGNPDSDGVANSRNNTAI